MPPLAVAVDAVTTSWLTLLGHTKVSLWSPDLLPTESILVRSHWFLVVMDQFARRIVGFGVQAVAVDGPRLCCMFNQAISGQGLELVRFKKGQRKDGVLQQKLRTFKKNEGVLFVRVDQEKVRGPRTTRKALPGGGTIPWG